MSVAESVAGRTAVLLDRVRAGQEQALGELFTLYRERLVVNVARRLCQEESAEAFGLPSDRGLSPGRRRTG